ncbi:MAG: hypothetical protein Satyrvirus32_7 [Satyrvirus sp.]|uniref:Uncharacterized protein n=1 Tax=Satyrvirus sp. TaxID=2487771 RepID=A0A3G5AEV4_9VIRU|nr:MAG: hypothetical protein Satyrvirus32_7 [Satyrvirus sp.]
MDILASETTPSAQVTPKTKPTTTGMSKETKRKMKILLVTILLIILVIIIGIIIYKVIKSRSNPPSPAPSPSYPPSYPPYQPSYSPYQPQISPYGQPSPASYNPSPNPAPNSASPQTCKSPADCQNNGNNNICNNGVCSPNSCSQYSTCPSISGSDCGWCYDGYQVNGYQGVAFPGDDDGPSNSDGQCTSYVYNEKNCPHAQVCAATTSCSLLPEHSWCVWCKNLGVALYSDTGSGSDPAYNLPPGVSCDGVNTWGDHSSEC